MTAEPQNTEETEEAFRAREAAEAEAEPEKTEYVEFVGMEPHGTDFYGETGTHSITAAHMKEHHDVALGKKEVVWKRGKNRRFLVPSADLTPEAVAVLADDPMFKVVSL